MYHWVPFDPQAFRSLPARALHLASLACFSSLQMIRLDYYHCGLSVVFELGGVSTILSFSKYRKKSVRRENKVSMEVFEIPTFKHEPFVPLSFAPNILSRCHTSKIIIKCMGCALLGIRFWTSCPSALVWGCALLFLPIIGASSGL